MSDVGRSARSDSWRPRVHYHRTRWIRRCSSFQSPSSDVDQGDWRASSSVDVFSDSVGWCRRRSQLTSCVRRRRTDPTVVHPAAGRDPANSADFRRAAATRAEQRAWWRKDSFRHRTHSPTYVREPERPGDRHHGVVVDPRRSSTTQYHRTQTADVGATDSAASERQRRRRWVQNCVGR